MGIIKKLVRKKCLQLLAPLPILSQNRSALIPFPASQFAPTLLEGSSPLILVQWYWMQSIIVSA
jgi:hypothetical protein